MWDGRRHGDRKVSVEIPDEKASNAMSLVAEADYTVIFREGMEPPAGWEESFWHFMKTFPFL